MTTDVIDVKKLSKLYEPTPRWMRLLVRSATRTPVVALEDVSLQVEAGQICAIIGPNGAGKSTLFRVLTGLTTPTAGVCRVLGMDPITEAHRIRRRIGFMPAEDRTLFLRHTCQENLRFHGRLQGLEKSNLERRIDEVLDLVGLWEARQRTGFALSSGMRSRLMLARAILHEPRVLILDEPTGAIDPVAAFDLLQSIQEISSHGGLATLISSHRVEEIEALRDNVMLLDRGRVVYWGDLGAIRETWEQTRYEVTFSDSHARDNAMRYLVGVDGCEVLPVEGDKVSLLTDEATGPLLARLSDQLGSITSITQSPMPLRDLLRRVLAASDPDSGAT